MEKYKSYKPSGVEWIGEIPKEWGVSKYKYKLNVLSGFPFKSELFDSEIGFPLLRIRDITSGTIETFYNGDYDEKYIIKKGDVLIGMDGDFNIREWDNDDILLNQRCCKIQNYNGLLLKYIFYTLPFDLHIINDLTYFTTVKHLSVDDLYNIKCVVPPLSEQNQIVQFLDSKTELIDKLISTKERKITLLNEQRTSLINQVVTKGLNPNVKMKDSGVEWIGEIPEGWKLLPLKYTLINNKESIRTGPFGSSLKSDEFIDEGIRVYNQRSVYDEDFSKSDIFISKEKFEELKGFIVIPGDILITSRGTIGRMTIVPSDGEIGVLHPCLIRLRLNNKLLISKYLWWYINHSSLFINSVKIESNSTTIEVIYSETLSSVRLPIPSCQEQLQIVELLDSKTKEIDDLVQLEQKKIDLLKEYRKSLISEVVTGKIKVTND